MLPCNFCNLYLSFVRMDYLVFNDTSLLRNIVCNYVSTYQSMLISVMRIALDTSVFALKLFWFILRYFIIYIIISQMWLFFSVQVFEYTLPLNAVMPKELAIPPSQPIIRRKKGTNELQVSLVWSHRNCGENNVYTSLYVLKWSEISYFFMSSMIITVHNFIWK